MNFAIRVAGVSAVVVSLLWIGYLLYDKDPKLSAILLFAGLILAVIFILSEIQYKHKELYLRSRGYLRNP